jgi:hypothetical protein
MTIDPIKHPRLAVAAQLATHAFVLGCFLSVWVLAFASMCIAVIRPAADIGNREIWTRRLRILGWPKRLFDKLDT